MDQETRTDSEQRLEHIAKLLEEVVDDNTAVVASMNQLAQSQQAMSVDLSREVAALRGEVAGGLAYRTLKDLVTELTTPLAAMEAMIAADDFTDPDTVATHVRGLAATLRSVLSRMGAVRIAVDVGAVAFDPTWHKCVGVLDVSESPFPDAAPRTVVRVVEHGYVLDGRLLTPAAVEIQGGRADAGTPPDRSAEPDVPAVSGPVSE
ncbi:nucleotide exchange factor GrpE [Actinosynnema sp. ALI-1.44]|uniref:nucleotide exchange factor GrpE n=1 Tax=Actinosynnema sp. ALI-1.44 TaxID=1933779 RepID=UPI00097BCDAF|nr:nucleotide exchange factor GrpE [Actinosynnema sp. ALI-1.44]ONI77971.1 nucleotide exchange factor GrpE [Actinosynnema sp. ALI-1.44]